MNIVQRLCEEVDDHAKTKRYATSFMAFVSSCRPFNTPQWMLMLANNLNTLAKQLKLDQRWCVDPRTGEIWDEANPPGYVPCDECGGTGACDSGGVREDGNSILVACGKCSTKATEEAHWAAGAD